MAEVLSELPAEVDVEKALERALAPENAPRGDGEAATEGLKGTAAAAAANLDNKVPSGALVDPPAAAVGVGKASGMAATVNEKLRTVRILAHKVGHKLTHSNKPAGGSGGESDNN